MESYRSFGDKSKLCLTLTHITYEELIPMFIEGCYKTLSFPQNEVNTIDLDEIVVKMEEKVTKNGQSSVYLLIAANKEQKKIAHHIDSILSNEYYFVEERRKETIRCLHCGRVKEDCIGIPLKIRNQTFNNIITIETEGSACNFQCALSYARKTDSCKIYTNRSSIIRCVYELYFPGEKLNEARDPILLKIYGGSLTDQEFDDNTKSYMRTTNIEIHKEIVLEPVRILYENSLN